MAFSRKALQARGRQRAEQRSGRQQVAADSYVGRLRQGEAAFHGGMAIDTNPHPPGTEDHDTWREGWEDARDTK